MKSQTKRKSLTSKSGNRKLILDKVIGNTSNSTNNFISSPSSSEIAFLAGCVVVIYDYEQDKQTKFLFSPSNKPFASICFSENGKYLAAGEVTLNFHFSIIFCFGKQNLILYCTEWSSTFYFNLGSPNKCYCFRY